jgi:hypothetical protein
MSSITADSVIFVIVHAENTLGRDPLPGFFFKEFFHSPLLDTEQIFNLTHAVALPVTGIEPLQPVAGKLGTAGAEPARAFPAYAQPAVHAGCWLVLFGVIAPVTGISFTQIGPADTAVHPAGCNDRIVKWRGMHGCSHHRAAYDDMNLEEQADNCHSPARMKTRDSCIWSRKERMYLYHIF